VRCRAYPTIYYEPRRESADHLWLMRLLDEQYTCTPNYGIRRMTAWLRTQEYQMNHKRVQRLLRLMGLEAIYQKPRPGQFGAGQQVYPYLLRGVSIARVNQVWSTDITYICLLHGFVYLLAILTCPPTLGQHLPSIARWGIHTQPILDELQVHNLEDRGVMVHDNCRDCDALIAKLEAIVSRYSDKVILTPDPKMDTRIALTAWGGSTRLTLLTNSGSCALSRPTVASTTTGNNQEKALQSFSCPKARAGRMIPLRQGIEAWL
jgi:helix-turn-helix protein/uncharacterized protein DUF3105